MLIRHYCWNYPNKLTDIKGSVKVICDVCSQSGSLAVEPLLQAIRATKVSTMDWRGRYVKPLLLVSFWLFAD